jgi:hypothetical protein
MTDDSTARPESQNRWRWAPTDQWRGLTSSDWRSALGVVAVVGLLKLAYSFLQFDLSAMAGNEWAFGFEVGHIAGNLTNGLGFAILGAEDTLVTTAWLSPLYPIFLAGIFKVLGVHTLAAANAMLGFNCLFQALTAGLIFLMGLRFSGRRTGLIAVVIFFLNPNVWHFLPWAWPSQLFALLVSLHFFSLLVPPRSPALAGAAAGGTFALALLTDGAAITLAPVALIHFAVIQGRERFPTTVAAALVCFAVVMAPWTIRNYRHFDTFNPLRGNAGVNLWVGNHPGATAESFHGLSQSPWHNGPESEIFIELGERDYDRMCRERAFAEIKDNPSLFISNSTVRFLGFWFGEWWVQYKDIPWYYSLGLVVLTLLAAAGAYRSRRRGTGILVVTLLLFGAPYYLTVHGHGRYRVPIEPLMCLAAALPRSRAISDGDREPDETEPLA